MIMLPGILVYRQTDVNLEASQDANRSIRLAAQQLLRNDPYASRSRIGRMSDFAKNLLGDRRSFEDYDLAIQIAVAQGRYEEAAAFQEKALDIFEGTEEETAAQYLRMGYLCSLLQDYDRALIWLNLGISGMPTVQAVLVRAQVRLNLGDTAGAVADANACLAAAEDEISLLPDMVNIYEAAGEYETAVRLWTKVLAQADRNEYRLDRAYCLVQLGRMEEAEADISLYLRTNGADRETANAMMGLGYLRIGDYARANEAFRNAAAASEGKNPSLYYYTVLCAYLTGDYARAREYGEELIRRLASGEDIGTADLRLENASGRLQVTMVPVDRAQLYRMTGASCLAAGDYTRAAEVLTEALAEKEDPYLRYLRGSSLLAAERFSEALEDFRAAEEAGTEAENCRYSIGVCHAQLGNRQEAAEAFAWVAENGENASLREEAERQLRLLNQETTEAVLTTETPENGDSVN